TTLLSALGLPPLDLDAGLRAAVDAALVDLPDERRLVRGLFSGGTLCYEALVILSGILGPVYSNTPLRKGWGLPAPDDAHVCLDLGEEEFTKGRPHPMIDPEARLEHLRGEGAKPDVAVVLLDVVLGYGSHPDPAQVFAPVCADIRAGGRGPAVVAYVLGTDADPQGLAAQRATLADAGCIVPPTAGRAAAHDRAVPPGGRDAGGARLRRRRCPRGGAEPALPARAGRPPRPGLHRGPGGLPHPRRARPHRSPAGQHLCRANGAPRRRLHHSRTHRVPAAGDLRRRPGAGCERALAQAPGRRLRSGRHDRPQRRRSRPVRLRRRRRAG